MTFDENGGLTKDQVGRAAALTVIAQNGLRVQFGELFKERKTIVVFIRHFWCVVLCGESATVFADHRSRCAMCQDYMYSISRNVDVEALKREASTSSSSEMVPPE